MLSEAVFLGKRKACPELVEGISASTALARRPVAKPQCVSPITRPIAATTVRHRSVSAVNCFFPKAVSL